VVIHTAENSVPGKNIDALPRILGLFFILDGLSLLLRGAVGGLFLIHESSTFAFVIGYILHTIVGGLVYTYFGYSQLRNCPWTHGIVGFLIATSALIWILPSLGADYFTGVLGIAALLLNLIYRIFHK